MIKIQAWSDTVAKNWTMITFYFPLVTLNRRIVSTLTCEIETIMKGKNHRYLMLNNIAEKHWKIKIIRM